MLENYPVYKGLQPVYPNWSKVFSKKLLYQLDYILMDALTLPEKDGSWLRIWRANTKVADKEAFMKRYVDFNMQILSSEPVDIFAWPTFLPACIADEYDVLWTNELMQKIIDAAKAEDRKEMIRDIQLSVAIVAGFGLFMYWVVQWGISKGMWK